MNVELELKNAIIASFGGIAEYYNKKEIKWNDNSTIDRTFERRGDDTIIVKKRRKDGSLFIKKVYVNNEIIYQEERYPNGKLNKVYHYKNGKKVSGKEYYENGQLFMNKQFYKGRMHGTMIAYFYNGDPVYECVYKYGQRMYFKNIWNKDDSAYPSVITHLETISDLKSRLYSKKL